MVDTAHIPLNWQLGHSQSLDDVPHQFVAAVVPGAVQLDWARAHAMADFTVGDNAQDYCWMEDVFWHYRASLAALPPPAATERLSFVCAGIDYRFCIRCGGTTLLEQEGMYTPLDIDISDYAGTDAVLEVIIYPAPKSIPHPPTRDQADQCVKPAVSYGWDFHPRLIPLGIWESAAVLYRPTQHLRSLACTSLLDDDFAAATLTLELHTTPGCESSVQLEVFDPQGQSILTLNAQITSPCTRLQTRIATPQLWWPRTEGAQALYRVNAQLIDTRGACVQQLAQRIGFRRVELVMNQGSWDEPSTFPKSRSIAPITLQINGRRIFCKGANFVGPELFYATTTAQRYDELLTLAADAGMNLLRCWGGSGIQKEPFFERADELGIMLWQEFPLACNNYRSTPHYLEVLEQEARSIVRRLRVHPSVVLWCGGNELFNNWSGMTDQSLALRLLNHICFELDPHTPFLPTSPVMGMGHGAYAFKDGSTNLEVLSLFRARPHSAYTEFGIDSTASVESLRRMLPEADMPQAGRTTPFITARAEADFGPQGRLWSASFISSNADSYFDNLDSVEQVVAASRFLQAVGLRAAFEEARRQWPRCSMALNWCLNEPWPALSNQSIIEYPATPKPAFMAVKNALRPVMASAFVAKLVWSSGEAFAAELWMHNDSDETIGGGELEATVELDGIRTVLLQWHHPSLAARTNIQGPQIRYLLPQAAGCTELQLHLTHRKHPLWNAHYSLLYRPGEQSAGLWHERGMNG
jgi:beta-mannosidase